MGWVNIYTEYKDYNKITAFTLMLMVHTLSWFTWNAILTLVCAISRNINKKCELTNRNIYYHQISVFCHCYEKLIHVVWTKLSKINDCLRSVQDQ